MINLLEASGTIYLILSVIASIIIWANSTIQNPEYQYFEDYITSPAMVAYGFAVLIQGIMVTMIFYALAKILKKLNG